jgi:hypothetical protein
MCEMGMLVEVLLAIPGKPLSLTTEPGSNQVSADLVEQPVSFGAYPARMARQDRSGRSRDGGAATADGLGSDAAS